ncbi:PRC-barrel domain-containing protein [Jannaschia ovalis]|uniref:PRC-barrel domain-containing protein n=1 Tax=Jannaschia ovalis TaxID=3038773 RepID=A0ABY8L7Y7_9RHOB|nr:PRC-barrel domain-containing protein [Jannaschia sp. GRR-S6-38]WGH77374.1 PRC-barrel domain-containing protein [Jannaschia sp. GRR-S6-38]
MLRPLTVAAAIALTAPMALADAHSDSPFADGTLQYGEDYLATTLIGTRVHITEDELLPGVALATGTVDEWDDIGEIGDMIIGVDGTLDAVIIDVGGFLGLGEREVAIKWSALRGVYEEDNLQEYFLGLNLTREELEAAPEVTRVPVQ